MSHYLLLACLLSGLLASIATAQQKISLHYGLHEGQAWSFDQVTEGLQNTDMSSEGQPPFRGEQRMRQIRQGTITVLKVESGVATSVRVKFDPACKSMMKSSLGEQTFDFPFAGKTITLTRNAQGQITNDFSGQVDPMAIGELNTYLPSNNAGFPDHPVAVGEQWEPDLKALRQAQGLGDNDKAVAACKIASIDTIAGRPAAEVITYLSTTKTQEDCTFVNTMQGSVWYDLETGNMVQSSMNGTSSMKGTMTQRSPNGMPMRVTMNNTGKMEFRLKTGPANAAPAPASTPPFVPPGEPLGPLTPDAPPVVNPLSPPGAATPPPLPGAAANAQNQIDLVQYVIPDPYLRMNAWTLVAPKDWKVDGGVSWIGKLDPPPAYVTQISAMAPDGSASYMTLPLFFFIQTDNPMLAGNGEIAPVMDPKTCIERVILPRCRAQAQNVKIIGFEALPKMIERTQKNAALAGLNPANLKIDAGRALVEYSFNGNAFEEFVYCSVVATQTPTGILWCTDEVFAYSAPKGKLKDAMPVLGTIASSVRRNPTWAQASRQELARIVAANSRPPQVAAGSGGTLSILDVSKSMARDQDSFIKGLNASAAARDHALSISHGNILGQQPMYDPALGEPVNVPNGYLNYYRDYYGVVHGSDLNAADFYSAYHMNTTQLTPGSW